MRGQFFFSAAKSARKPPPTQHSSFVGFLRAIPIYQPSTDSQAQTACPARLWVLFQVHGLCLLPSPPHHHPSPLNWGDSDGWPSDMWKTFLKPSSRCGISMEYLGLSQESQISSNLIDHTLRSQYAEYSCSPCRYLGPSCVMDNPRT